MIYDRPMRWRAALTIAFICFAAAPASRAAECKSAVNESAWAKRLPDAMKFLFADWKPSPPAQAVDE